MQDLQKQWLRRLADLRPNVSLARGSGAGRFAPHKPLLLLALVECAEANELPAPRLPLTAGLRLRFNSLWRLVVTRWTTKPDLTLPFHHLSTQKFWRALREDGSESQDPGSTRQIELDPGFFALLGQPQFRQLARLLLIQTWFPDNEQAGLATAVGLEVSPNSSNELIAEAKAVYETIGRDARFRIQVIAQYQYTCALTGYTLTAIRSGASMVEAAHIAAFADTRNNDPRNGLALTPDAHWSFDEGLWTIDDRLNVVVAKEMFSDGSPDGASLLKRHGSPLHFASPTQLRPAAEYLDWHRNKRFVGRA
ncbi:MAG: hypothetical protein RIQ93_641 [Verrucomicrobiota bacterium]|jgi:putative restriction endonuclease